jgi:hypothetical protein
MAVGYIYVLTNPGYPDHLKVGFTKESAEERASGSSIRECRIRFTSSITTSSDNQSRNMQLV